MKQTASFISTYASDTSGVCSALYELGGMTVMHDPSGCNSTYNTHDEPRWYDFDSMVYISGLSEIEAIMGDDDKLIRDIVYSAKELSPKFITIAGTPIPMMIGTDFEAIASVIEKETGIVTMGLDTNGMHSYEIGASRALESLAKRFVKKDIGDKIKNSVNILGANPLDFSVNGSVESIKKLLQENRFNVIGTWAMGSDLEELTKASLAQVNLVISYSGLATAKYLYKEFDIPYVIGTPIGEKLASKIINDLKESIDTGKNKISYDNREIHENPEVIVIGESIMSESLAYGISKEYEKSVRVISSLETEQELLLKGDYLKMDEDEITPYLDKSKIVIADPLYKMICQNGCDFRALPHEGFSGRIYRDDIPNLINNI